MGKHLSRQDMIELGYIPTFKNYVMKLKHFNPETCHQPAKTKDLYMVLRKNGSICFTKPALDALKLDKGIKVEIAQDDESKEWYLCKHKNGFELRNLGQQLGFSSTQLVNIMWPDRKDTDKSKHMIIAPDPIVYEGIGLHLLTYKK